jgi:hypothetical protein
MTIGGALLSLMATAGAAPAAMPATHAGLDPPLLNVAIGVTQPIDMGTALRRNDPLLLALQDAPASAPAAQTPPPAPPEDLSRPESTPSQDALINGRRRPGVNQHDLPDAVNQVNPGAIRSPAPDAFPVDHIPIPDRWRLSETLGLVHTRWWDPYNQNTLKGDRPICVTADESEAREHSLGCRVHRLLGLQGSDWFFVANAIADTVFEPRSFPIPGGVQTTENSGEDDVFGRDNSIVAAQTLILSASLIKGSTAFLPPDIEYRITLAAQANYVDVPERRVLSVRPSNHSQRFDYALGVQEFFVDKDLHHSSDRFDFYSLRIGIQEFQFDFRGFLFQDNQLGIRLFGNRDNNRWQFNLAAIWRLEKDTNSGLNNILQTPRSDWVLHANLFRQDFPVPGFTSEASLTWNINREHGSVEVDDNGFPTRPALLGNLRTRSYDAFYLGYNGDGHFGRLNLTVSAYGLFGQDRQNVFTGRNATIRAFFAAAEPSFDFNWIRIRGSALFASGDGNPYDNHQGGFDAIFENPIFAGADTSYWIRQAIPFAGGARAVTLTGRNGVLIDLRSSKEQGQSNFVNPGTVLLGVGADFDITPRFRLSTNVNHLWFENVAVIRALRMQGTIRNDVGWDLSAAAIFRPLAIQNLVFRLSGAVLQPGTGFRDLFVDQQRDRRYYSILFNAVVTY